MAAKRCIILAGAGWNCVFDNGQGLLSIARRDKRIAKPTASRPTCLCKNRAHWMTVGRASMTAICC